MQMPCGHAGATGCAGGAFKKRPELSRKFGPGRDAWGIQRCQNDSAKKEGDEPDPGTGGIRLGLLRSRSDPVGRAPMRGGPSMSIVRETRKLHQDLSPSSSGLSMLSAGLAPIQMRRMALIFILP